MGFILSGYRTYGNGGSFSGNISRNPVFCGNHIFRNGTTDKGGLGHDRLEAYDRTASCQNG